MTKAIKRFVLREYRYCGQSQDKTTAMKCPAFGTVCNKCKKENHFASKCAAGKNPRKKKTKIGRESRGKFLNQLKESEDELLVTSRLTLKEKLTLYNTGTSIQSPAYSELPR